METMGLSLQNCKIKPKRKADKKTKQTKAITPNDNGRGTKAITPKNGGTETEHSPFLSANSMAGFQFWSHILIVLVLN